jgi:ATP-dependent helicase HrpA
LRGLADDVCDRTVERCCFPLGEAPPRTRADFEAAAERGRAELYDEAVRIVAVAKQALNLRRDAAAALQVLPEGVDPALIGDCRLQLSELAEGRFVRAAPDPWLDSLPRFLRALGRRIGKLRAARGPAMDAQYELRTWREAARKLAGQAHERSVSTPAELVLLRWMVEEYGVSLFAQELRTSLPVSPRRLDQQLAAARAALSA